MCVTPYFLAYPHVFLTCGPFTGFLGFIWRFSLLQLCWRRLPRHFFCSPYAVRLFWRFSFDFAIFALVSDYLGIFCFLPRLPLLGCLLCSACLFSSLVTCLVGLGCSPPALLTPVVFPLGVFFLWRRCYVFFYLLLRVLSAFAAPLGLVCPAGHAPPGFYPLGVW